MQDVDNANNRVDYFSKGLELSTRVINGAKIRLPLISTQTAVSMISYVLPLPDWVDSSAPMRRASKSWSTKPEEL